ncbi:MAG: hypothetical protein J5I35_11495 [Methanothrix harundinacea]|nr:hypothetical protein [Methanothrix harundinacea]
MVTSSPPVVIPDQLKGRGLRFTRLRRPILGDKNSGKGPIDPSFYDGGALAEDDDSLLSYIKAGGGFGLVCNFGDLAAFDADEGEELEALGIMARLPPTLTDKAPNKPESLHLYYICPGLPKTFHFYHPTKTVEKAEKGEEGGEVKQLVRLELGQICAGRGHITGPGAPHWSGGRREIIDDSPLAEITVDDLRAILRGLAFSDDPTKNPTFETAAGLEEKAGRWDALEEITRKARRGRRGDGPSLSERIGDIRRVLDTYGWSPTTKSGDNWKGDIPGEVSKSKTALAVDVKKGVWFCHHHADSGGDAAALVALFEGLINCRGKDHLRDSTTFKAVIKACEEKGLIDPEPDDDRGRGEISTEGARDFIETVKEGLIEDPRKLKDRAVLAALLTLREKDPLEFDLLTDELKGAGVVKLPTLKKMIDGEERRQADEKAREEEEGGEDGPEVSEEIKKKAREILETGDPIKARCDYVSRTVEGNTGVAKAFIYSCSSAYMPVSDKLHADAVGASQGGKSVTVGAVHSTYPPENLEILTEASPKSVYYLAKRYEDEGRSFDDVILYINDARGEHIPVLKVFRDDGPGAPRNLTVVDGESLDLTVPGRPIVQSSSVLPLRDDEGQAVSRSFLATVADVDEAGEKMVRGKIRQGLRYGALRRPEADTQKAVLQQMGRILRDEGIRDVVVPFDADEPSSADRRGTGQFVRLIKISAHENQFQRPILEMTDGRRFVIATYADLQNAAELWFEFEEAQAFKINHKVLKVFKALPTTEPDHYNFTDSSPSKNRIAKDTGISPKSVGRYLSDLYDAGLIYRKKAGAPGNPHVFWTTDQLRQKVMSQISATGDGEGELGQIETKNGCPKYLGKNCPDSLKNSFKAFFTNQDIIKKENVKGVSGISARGAWSVSGGDILSSLDFLANRVLNAPSKATDSDYLRHCVLSQMSEIPPAIDSKMGRILSRGGRNVSKDEDHHQTIAENLAEDRRRQAEEAERTATPPPKPKGDEDRAPTIEEAEALEVARSLQAAGKRVTFGNVEDYLEKRAGGYVEPKMIKRFLNALASQGWTTDKEGALSEGVVE